MTEDIRPESYRYYNNLVDHVGGEDVFFNGDLVYPRQLEIHLPGDHRKACDLKCAHCQGHLFKKDLDHWEPTVLSLLHKLEGKVPFHVYGGAYTEPTINPYLMSYLATTKYYNNCFGIHTNGVSLWQLQETHGWLDELDRLGANPLDYLSVSLDAGSPLSHQKGKGVKEDYYTDTLKAIKYLSKRKRTMSVRLCYLFNKWNSSVEEIENIVAFAKEAEVDSLRFSIPYAHYNQQFDKVEQYKEKNETPNAEKYRERLTPYLSESHKEKPYIFYVTPIEGYTDIALYDFKQCIYGYYQITFASDGYVYRCSAIGAPDMAHLRLGKATDSIEEFEQMNRLNQDPNFNCMKGCFEHGGRCNRMAVECNRKFRNSTNTSE